MLLMIIHPADGADEPSAGTSSIHADQVEQLAGMQVPGGALRVLEGHLLDVVTDQISDVNEIIQEDRP